MTLPALLDGGGRVVLVAGAAGGIGRATLALFKQAGASTCAFDLRPREAQPDADLVVVGDAASEADVARAVAETTTSFGRIDWVVNAVGVTGFGPLEATSADDWHRLLGINLDSAFFLARAARPELKKNRGALVLMSSSNAINGGSAVSGAAYAVAKAGLLNLSRYLAKEWAPDRIRVNCVAPGPVATPMLDRLDAAAHAALIAAIPLKRYAEAAEVAAVIGFLCSSGAASMTGTCINVSGGLVLD